MHLKHYQYRKQYFSQVVKELNKLRKSFLYKKHFLKVKYKTASKDYKGGGLKNVDISYKILSLQ